MILAIDPGIWEIGYCGGGPSGGIAACGVSRVVKTPHLGIAVAARGHVTNLRALGLPVLRAFVESMSIRPTDGLAVSNDLLAVQSVGCLVAASLCGHVELTPVQKWKGSIPKSIHHPRILDALRGDEYEIVVTACKAAGKKNTKEVLDAVGLWLYSVGRIDNAGAVLHSLV